MGRRIVSSEFLTPKAPCKIRSIVQTQIKHYKYPRWISPSIFDIKVKQSSGAAIDHELPWEMVNDAPKSQAAYVDKIFFFRVNSSALAGLMDCINQSINIGKWVARLCIQFLISLYNQIIEIYHKKRIFIIISWVSKTSRFASTEREYYLVKYAL